MKEFFNNKKVIYILIGLFVVVILIFLGVVLFKKDAVQEDESGKLLEQFEKIGLDFYENFYYPQTGTTTDENEKFLAKYSSTGIKVNLNNLISMNYKFEEYGDILAELVEKCDKANTKVIVYPQAPYEQKSYRSEIVTDCNFEK